MLYKLQALIYYINLHTNPILSNFATRSGDSFLFLNEYRILLTQQPRLSFYLSHFETLQCPCCSFSFAIYLYWYHDIRNLSKRNNLILKVTCLSSAFLARPIPRSFLLLLVPSSYLLSRLLLLVTGIDQHPACNTLTFNIEVEMHKPLPIFRTVALPTILFYLIHRSVAASTICNPVSSTMRGVGFVCHLKRRQTALFSTSATFSYERQSRPIQNVAIIGGGLAGLSTAYHLLELRQPRIPLNITIYDRCKVGEGGASAVAGGWELF